jgi:hypothetical protein
MMTIGEVKAAPGKPLNLNCTHAPHIPVFNPDAAKYWSAEQVRKNYPRYDSVCSLCKQRVILYASMDHLIAGGDWTPPPPPPPDYYDC